jgi:hypothetical protein
MPGSLGRVTMSKTTTASSAGLKSSILECADRLRVIDDMHPVHAGELFDGAGVGGKLKAFDRGRGWLAAFSQRYGPGVGPDGGAGQGLIDIEHIADDELAGDIGALTRAAIWRRLCPQVNLYSYLIRSIL